MPAHPESAHGHGLASTLRSLRLSWASAACPACPAPQRPHLKPPAAPAAGRQQQHQQSWLFHVPPVPCTPCRAPAGLTPLQKTPTSPSREEGHQNHPQCPLLTQRWAGAGGHSPARLHRAAAHGRERVAVAERSSSPGEGVWVSAHLASEGVSPTEGRTRSQPEGTGPHRLAVWRCLWQRCWQETCEEGRHRGITEESPAGHGKGEFSTAHGTEGSHKPPSARASRILQNRGQPRDHIHFFHYRPHKCPGSRWD